MGTEDIMLKKLKHRERVMRSIYYRDIDRIPFFFRADPVLENRIRNKLGLKNHMEVIKFFDADALHINVPIKQDYLCIPEEDGEYTDIYGNRIRKIKGDNITTHVVIKPVLENATSIEDIYKIKWPDKNIIDINKAKEDAYEAYSTDLAVYGGIWASIFTHARFILGEENFLISLIENPNLVSTLIKRLTDFYIEVNEHYFSACSKYIDIFYFGSDFGTQTSMFISKKMFQSFFKLSLKRIVEHAKVYGLKVMFHTCGAIKEIIPDLIECGVDILDPVQVYASNMDAKVLSKNYKGRIIFHGGISTQKILPFKNPSEVEREVESMISTLGPLGYIVCPDQDMIGDIPFENIISMYNAIKNYRV